MKFGPIHINRQCDIAAKTIDQNFHGPKGATLRHGLLLVRMGAYKPVLGIWRYFPDGSANLTTVALVWWPTSKTLELTGGPAKRVRLPWKHDA